jgi:hypothetical protein
LFAHQRDQAVGAFAEVHGRRRDQDLHAGRRRDTCLPPSRRAAHPAATRGPHHLA